MGRTVLLSGQPGVGKTTLIQKIIATMPGRWGGFYTQEIRGKAARLGFEIVTLDGHRALLAHIDKPGSPRVGKYGVYVENVDSVAVPALYRAVAESDYVVIDEIGKMELLSEAFRAAVLYAVQSPKTVLGSIIWQKHPWADALKNMPGVSVLAVTLANRQRLLDQILPLLAG
ncbi:MAG: NTPase [Chloroflexi bacterium]|nr:NTPase [Chloroflexota bacterium]